MVIVREERRRYKGGGRARGELRMEERQQIERREVEKKT